VNRKSTTYRIAITLSVCILGIIVLWLSAGLRKPQAAAATPHKVHIAFGFHVNLYHSFRHDTNDENGFGQDIRVIRHIIRTLDHYNRQGIPVKGVWDFDNLFSLEEILPVHAKDIIEDIRRRVRHNGDEVLLMSYNNGMVSAMTREELTAAMSRAITNDRGSGVVDLFGEASMIVRPQEMMTSPGNFDIYNSLGIQHTTLYYSATPFDAFRMFVRQLLPVEAYNPISYRNPETGETTVIIPSYHVGDLVEHVSLRRWVEKLQRMQAEGEVDRDLLIFLNFDADSEFWVGGELPWYLEWLPNTGGIFQLIDSVADLPGVTFSTVGEYVENRSPVGSIHFNQDTADGSFNGYHSWAEKSYASDFWTRIVRNRRAVTMAKGLFALPGMGSFPAQLNQLIADSFETRLRALSTTHFGLAAPFLTRQRELVVDRIQEKLDRYSRQIEKVVTGAGLRYLWELPAPNNASHGEPLDRFLVLDPVYDSTRKNREYSLSITLPEGYSTVVADRKGNLHPVRSHRVADDGNLKRTVVTMDDSLSDGAYFLYDQAKRDKPKKPVERKLFADTRTLKNEMITVRLTESGHVRDVTAGGETVLHGGSLLPYILHGGKRLAPGPLSVTVTENGTRGSAAIRLKGKWAGPAEDTRRAGWVDYRLRLNPKTPYLFVQGEVRYPETYRKDLMHGEKPMLARRVDRSWQAAVPMELRFAPRTRQRQPVVIEKRNFLGVEAAYPVDYYRHSPENRDLDSINNHVTAEYAGTVVGDRGLAVAMDTRSRANFAFCPFRLDHDSVTGTFGVTANPFGTYDGRQYLPPTRGNRLGYETTILSGAQFHSAAPTFNGYFNRFAVMVAFFKGDKISETVKADLIGFARPPSVLMAGLDSEILPGSNPAPLPPAGLLALPVESGVLFHWDSPATDTIDRYQLVIREENGTLLREMETTLTTMMVMDLPALSGSRYTATVAAIGTDGRARVSPEIRFSLDKTALPLHASIPGSLKVRMIWANFSAWIESHLL